MNNVQLTGRITKDPEIKYTPSGTAYMGFVLAVNRRQKDANGNLLADFITCKVFGATAEFISKYIKKGYMLGIEGEIQTGQFQAQDGKTHYTTDVMVRSCENLTPRDASATNPQPSATPQQPQSNGGLNYQPPSVDNEDMPF